MHRRLIPLVLLFFLSACQAGGLLEAEFPDLSRGFGGGSLAPGELLFQDDFLDRTSGWAVFQEEGAQGDYVNGEYRFNVERPNWYYWTTPGLQFTDVQIDVLVTRRHGTDPSLAGVICRYQDADNFYLILVSSDGYYALSRIEGGQETLLSAETMLASPVIMQGEVTNHMRVVCQEDLLKLEVNGAPVATAQDVAFSTGDVGLIVSALDGSDLEIAFDKLTILAP